MLTVIKHSESLAYSRLGAEDSEVPSCEYRPERRPLVASRKPYCEHDALNRRTPWNMSATIDDPATLDEIGETLGRLGYPAG